MESKELTNINIQYSPCILKSCTIGNILNNNGIEIFVTGTNESKTKSFLHYLTYDLSQKNSEEKNENTFLFQTWNYLPSKIINYIIPFTINGSENNSQKSSLSSGAFIFDSQLNILLSNNNNFDIYLVDDDIYTKPMIEKEFILLQSKIII